MTTARELGELPAYPVHPSLYLDSTGMKWAGMTKREAFAMAAMPSCYAEYFAGLARNEYTCDPEWRQGIAMESFRIADAMLAAATKDQP